jgi:hypothetical protein
MTPLGFRFPLLYTPPVFPLWKKERNREKKILSFPLTLPDEGWVDPTGKPQREKAQPSVCMNDNQRKTFVKRIIALERIFLATLS